MTRLSFISCIKRTCEIQSSVGIIDLCVFACAIVCLSGLYGCLRLSANLYLLSFDCVCVVALYVFLSLPLQLSSVESFPDINRQYESVCVSVYVHVSCRCA